MGSGMYKRTPYVRLPATVTSPDVDLVLDGTTLRPRDFWPKVARFERDAPDESRYYANVPYEEVEGHPKQDDKEAEEDKDEEVEEEADHVESK